MNENNQEYRYMIYNDLMKEYQFPSICEKTLKAADKLLFKKIGYDAMKHRFKIVKLKKEEAETIIQELISKYKLNRRNKGKV